MTKDKHEETKLVDVTLMQLLGKREALFEFMQKAYDLSRSANDGNKDEFLDASINIDNVRTEFINVLDQYNTRLITLAPTSKPDYQALSAFETLYGRVKRMHDSLVVLPTAGRTLPAKTKITLPPIELMSFNGDIRSWPLFYSNFISLIHENPSLSDYEKLHYLLGKLSGKAQTVCAGITPSADNYNLIFNSLIRRYEDKRTLAATYLRQIIDFKPLTAATASNLDIFNDKFVSSITALKNLKLQNLLDLIFLELTLSKLDLETVNLFENSVDQNVIPSFDELMDFINNRTKILQRAPAVSSSTAKTRQVSHSSYSNKSTPPRYNTYVSTVDSVPAIKCLCSNVTHQHLFKCTPFNNMTPQDRYNVVKNVNGCVNCLSIKHKSSNCQSSTACRVCKQRHHTLLHFTRDSNPRNPNSLPDALTTEPKRDTGSSPRHAPALPAPTAAGPSRSAQDVALCSTAIAAPCAALSASPGTVLLATAQVLTYDSSGRKQLIRVLLDSASQSHFITRQCCERLCLQPLNTHTTVRGFGGKEGLSNGTVNIEIFSRFNKNIKFDVSALVVDRITDDLPSAFVDISSMHYVNKLQLADNDFASPNKIDALIGASLFPHLIMSDSVLGTNPPAPPAIRTVFGYVLMGSVPTLAGRPTCTTSCCAIVQEPLENIITRFWELEEVPASPIQHSADVECEEFYRATTTRNPITGQYTVALPFDKDVFSLGDSFDIARRRFLCLEKKLEASPKLRAAYNDVINDYISKGYLSPVPTPSCETDADGDLLSTYVIPHHAVFREDKSTTKLRPVLDASCKTSTGVSLNEVLHSGANLQGDLFKIILNFRLHAVAMTADCKQMFLQILIRESDRRYQRIIYRFDPSDPLILYEFSRVCFGLKSSPFHALRTVRQLINDDGARYPRASEIASACLYMDDIAYSVETEEEAVDTANELIDLFKGAQWDLVKWNSNSRPVIDKFPASHRISTEVEFDKSTQHKILGLHWATDTDNFYFKIDPPDFDAPCTKRSILSTTARLWDIMGFVAPTILFAKLLIKQLWLLKVDWDNPPPANIIKLWRQFCEELPALNKILIPRCLGVTDDCEMTLVGFADASEQAYGGVLYAHLSSASGQVVRLLCAKSKVAPCTKLNTIARMELCAVTLLTKLIRVLLENKSYRFSNIYVFTDSKVVLYWIKGSPHRWHTFVANRVVKITEIISPDNCYHVAGTDNPADCLSRGVTPTKLRNHPLWFQGPPWLLLERSQWPVSEFDPASVTNDVPEQKTLTHSTLTAYEESVLYSVALRISSWSKLLRVIVYCCRFCKLLPRRDSTFITAFELEFAETRLLQDLQLKHFRKENKNFTALNKLRPFNHNGLIRVGGRLSNSGLSFTQQHPILLPHHDHVVRLLIAYYHKKYLHAGPELLLALLRQRYWILSARRIVRHIVHQCNICFRARPRPTFPLMADLPDCRTRQVTKAYTHTGCDFLGPVAYTPIRRRGAKALKAYICVFTCLTTRAVHLEVATDLSTASFLAALKRFLARRGPVQVMHSDNGTNFVGAKSYLRDLYKFLSSPDYRSRFENELSENRISWKFNCPTAPHFGGCWESMVKVVKTHLFKAIGQQLLSYEELVTVLVQVESLLNSRPLTVLSSDPAEPTALTPSHFLHTAPLLSLPAAEIDSDKISLLHRHALLDKIVQSFWKRWRFEYLSSLQTREKWNTPAVPITPGTVVVIMTNNAPPLTWPLAIVEKVHPAKDGVTRVVSVKTARGTYLRPVVRLCPLPSQ